MKEILVKYITSENTFLKVASLPMTITLEEIINLQKEKPFDVDYVVKEVK